MEGTADQVDTGKLDTQEAVQEQTEKLEGEEKAKETNGERHDIKPDAAHEEPTEKPHRGKTLEQMMSVKEGDDERTQISKKVSWTLRHGARKVGIEIDVDGWVNVSDILALSIMDGVSEEKLMDVIDESNQQKVRYELKDTEGDRGKAIRAVSKHTMSGMPSTIAREQRRLEREQRRDQRQDFKEAVARGEVPRDIEQDDSDPVPSIDDGPTYEQQLAEGYRPVYQGNRVVAMVKEGPEGAPLTMKPGRRTTRPEYKGEFKGGFKGDYAGKGDFKGDYAGKGNFKGDFKADYRGKGEFKGDFTNGDYRQKGDFKGYGASKGYGKDFRRDVDSYSYGSYRSGYGAYNKGEDERDYRGYKGSKSSKDGGKGYRDEKGYHDCGDDRRDYGRYRGKGNASEDVPQGRLRWRVCPGQEAVVRTRPEMESEAITKLFAGTLVYQTGDCITNEHGIIRMPMETVDGVRGWVTRTAEAADGPAFFKREGNGKGGRGYDGEKGPGKNYESSFGYGKGKSDRGGKTSSKGGQWDVSKGSKGTFENGVFSMGSGY